MKAQINRTIEDRLEQIEKDVNEVKCMLLNFLSKHTSDASNQEPLLNVKDVSAFLKIDNTIIYNACNKREIPFIKIGKSYKFKKDDILKWMENNQDKKEFNVDDYVNNYLQKNSLRG